MNSIVSKKCIIILFIILILKSVTVWSSDLEKIQKVNSPVSLKKIKFFDYNKNSIDIIDKKIDLYILNFWASWCAPCIKEMESLNNLKKKFTNIKIITVSQDADI